MGNEEKTPGYNGEQVEFSKQEAEALQEHLSERKHEAAEKNAEDREHQESSARNEIDRIALEKKTVEEKPRVNKTPERAQNSKINRKSAYKSIVKQTQAELSPASRAFSKVLHNPVIEKTSEIAASTVARPNAILSGAVFAFILTLLVYVIARSNGYPLSGSETIAAFIGGWIIGVVYDFFKIMITGKK